MAISPKLVQELREKTGVGMMDCKRALEESGGNLDEAVKVLRKKGVATAEKKAMRAASEGLVFAHVAANAKVGVLIEVNCETDFVAKTDDFQSLVAGLARQVEEGAPSSPEALLEQPFHVDTAQKVKDAIVAKVAQLGENIQVRRFDRYQTAEGTVAAYIHPGNKIGVLMETSCSDAGMAKSEEYSQIVKDLCMQVAASVPKFVRREQVTPEVLASEREIYRAQVLAQGKPANIVDKIVEGKMNKFYEESCLLEQPFIKDPSVSVQKHLASVAGDKIRVMRFTRYVLGEGLKPSGCDAP
jgi:elongation factor Ts